MFEIVKPGSQFPFIPKSKIFIFISLIVVLGSILLLLTRGLNLGIEFKGGNKLLIAFSDEAKADATRDNISEVISGVIEKSNPDSQIEIQSFEGDKDWPVKFQVSVEATTLVTDAQAKRITTQIISKLNDPKTLKQLGVKEAKLVTSKGIERPPETDRLTIVLNAETTIADTKAIIFGLLLAPRCCTVDGQCVTTAVEDGKPKTECAKGTTFDDGFSNMELASEKERNLDMEFLQEYNLRLLERQQQGEEISKKDFEKKKKSHDIQKLPRLKKIKDKVYIVNLQALRAKVLAALQDRFNPKDPKNPKECLKQKKPDGTSTTKCVEYVQVQSATSVSPSVGRDLLNKGLVSIFYAIIGILIYIGFRFDFRYSPGAVMALLHDSIITLGIFSLFQIKFTLPIIAALLTIIGYSLNDTIVVYDRIRENLTKFKGMDLAKLVNQSINETLSRTLLTSITTLLVVLALVFLGGGLIRDFAIALSVGIAVGTYSSVFVASPMVIRIDKYLERRRERAAKAARAPETA